MAFLERPHRVHVIGQSCYPTLTAAKNWGDAWPIGH